MGEHGMMRPDGTFGGALRLAVAAGFVVAAGCAVLLVVGRGGGDGTPSQDAGCDKLCAAAGPATSGSASASADGGVPANAAPAQHQGRSMPAGTATPPQSPPTPTGPAAPSQSPSTRASASSSPPSASGAGPAVSFTVTSHWPGGYHAEVVLTNATRAPISNWKLTFRVGGTATLLESSAANAVMNAGVLTLTPQDWNITVAAGDSVPLGFLFNGDYAAPSECTFNGQPCTWPPIVVH